MARGLRLTPDDRDHLFLLSGHRLPGRNLRGSHISPGLMRMMDRLQDTPAQIMGPLGETLLQTPPAALVAALRRVSEEFAALWDHHEVGLRWSDAKRFVHPEVGRIDLFCQTLLDPDRAQSLLIFTAAPGSDSHRKLALLNVLGTDSWAAG